MASSNVFGQPSFGITSDKVDAWVTEVGGHVAPVAFMLPSGKVTPMSIAPWWNEQHDIAPILQVLRGDFFCMPFGGNDLPFGDEQYPIHGETANQAWKVVSHSESAIEMSLETRIRPGIVKKRVWVEPGQTVVYQSHTIEGMKGPMCFGHHAMLKFRTVGNVTVAPFGFGQVFPGEFESPKQGGYVSLKAGARFTSLKQVPSLDGSMADLTSYPAREGFEDLVMVYSEKDATFGWTAVTFPDEGYIWFSLKDPRTLSGTVMWHSNGGRHYAPWSSRHRAVLGLEDVTSYMHYGLAGSVAPNDAQSEGYRTYVELKPDQPYTVNMIFGVAECPAGCRSISEIRRNANGITLVTDNGVEICVLLNIGSL